LSGELKTKEIFGDVLTDLDQIESTLECIEDDVVRGLDDLNDDNDIKMASTKLAHIASLSRLISSRLRLAA
jgi:hypothetical protein